MTRPIPLMSSQDSDTPEARCKSATDLVKGLLSEVEFEDVLRAALWDFAPTHVQKQQHRAAAHFLGVDEATVYRWATGQTSPKARDVWPLMFVAILKKLPVETQREVVDAITGIGGR